MIALSRRRVASTPGDPGLWANVAPSRHDGCVADPADAELLWGVPRIPASAGALIFDCRGRLLILNPTYKKHWTIPGGQVEADGETPWEACRRETLEECGLDVGQGRLVCVDFLRPKARRPGGMRFVFDCGTFDTSSSVPSGSSRRRSSNIVSLTSTRRRSCSAARYGAASWPAQVPIAACTLKVVGPSAGCQGDARRIRGDAPPGTAATLHVGSRSPSVPRTIAPALRLYERAGSVNRRSWWCRRPGRVGVGDGWERRSCLDRLLYGRTRLCWRSAAWAQVQKGRQAARRKAAPAAAVCGEKGVS